jgi:anti-anti-sigma factor
VDRGVATAVVRVRGELDYSSSDRLGSAIEGTQQADAQPVVVDLSECRYIDSTVLTVLIRASKTLGDTLRIVVPLDSHIRRIFAITNLDRMLNLDEKFEGSPEERP